MFIPSSFAILSCKFFSSELKTPSATAISRISDKNDFFLSKVIIPFVFINPDESPQSKSLVDLTNIPMVVAFKKGKVIANEYGNKKEIVQNVLNILL